MATLTKGIREWREELLEWDIEDLWEKLKEEQPDMYSQAKRIEWVFANKMSHITNHDGEPYTSRPMSKLELILLLDPPFRVDQKLLEAGFSIEEQKYLHIASDPVLWAETYLNISLRSYQKLILRHPSNRMVLRMGRRMGKTYSLAVALLHYAYTTNNGRCLVMAPSISQVGLIYDAIIEMSEGTTVADSIKRNVRTPHHDITLENGSTIRLFTTGSSNKSKSDGARGQEAHFIVLDEMDYMGNDDLDAIYAMLQKTSENQPEKRLIGASTPSGKKGVFYRWCTNDEYKEFYFPAMANPHWDKQMEEEFRGIYNENGYRQEIEADWGEQSEGVYPKRFVDAMRTKDWKYIPRRTHPESVYFLGIDWDKYGAGPNLCALELCSDNHPDVDLRGNLRIAFREEVPRSEYVLTETLERVIDLHSMFDFEWIYIDKGFGELQHEYLKKYGMENPHTMIHKRVKGIHFASTIEVLDPVSKEPEKKRMKPFMIDNLRGLFEKQMLYLPKSDDGLYLQLMTYVARTTNETGRPVFYMADDNVPDHAHDALLLAALAFGENYSDIMRVEYVRRARSFLSETSVAAPGVDDERTNITSKEEYVVGRSRRSSRSSHSRSRGRIKRANLSGSYRRKRI